MSNARRLFEREVLPFAAMVTVECTMVGLNTLFKAASLKGLSFYAFIFYSFALATLVLFPFAWISYRRSMLPPISYSILIKICFMSVIGILSGIFGYKGIEYSNPTLASAISNLTPAFTFILAILFRMEKVVIKSFSSLAKISGTIIAIGGAFIVVLYKGSAVLLGTNSPFETSLPASDWVIGGLLFTVAYLLVSLWYIVQVQTMKAYPSELVVVFLYNVAATLISAPVCLIAETNLSAWKLTNKTVLIAVVYAGFLGSSFSSTVHTWGLHLKGPVYISLFKPLSIAIAVAMGVSFLGETLYTGSIIGAIIISTGFYIAIWGKANEENNINISIGNADVTTERLPLLQETEKRAPWIHLNVIQVMVKLIQNT